MTAPASDDRDDLRRLRLEAELWRSLAENPFDFVVIVDRDGTFRYVNHGDESTKPEDLVGRVSVFAYLEEPYTSVVRSALDRAFDQGLPTHYESYSARTQRWYDTIVAPVRQGGRITAASMQTRDITERKRKESEARRADEQYRRIVEATRDGIWTFDVGGKTTFANHQMARMLGLDAAAMLGKPIESFLDPQTPEGAAATAFVAGRGVKTSAALDLRLVHRDGHAVSVVATLSALTDDGGRFAGTLVVVTDVSDRQRLERQLLEARKMDAIGRLAGGVAHEFNNLLTTIVGFSDLLASRLIDQEATQDVGRIRAAAERATALVRRLLTFARRQMSSPRTVDARGLVRDAERLLAVALGDDIELAVDIDERACPVHVDPEQLEQALVSLALNARDAMPDGGKLFVDVKHASDGRSVHIGVRDTGCGIPDAIVDRVFEPFFTTKDVHANAGLGLSLVYGVVQQAGGTVTVASRPGEGAAFSIALPRAEHQQEVARPREPVPVGAAAAVAGPAQPTTILVVEDNELVRGVTVRTLRAHGFDVLVAASGAEALATAREAPRLDLLLTDVVMPGMGGRELALKLREARPEVPVLFVSGYADDIFQSRGGLPDRARFIGKPFTASALAKAVRETIAQDGALADDGDR